MMKKFVFAVAAALALASQPSVSHAQVSTPDLDALTACINNSVTTEESVVTARWLFIAMSRHPSLPQTSRVSDADGLEANRRMGDLVNELVFNRCSNQTLTAIRSAGQEAALDVVFGTLGEKAMMDLMSNRDVLASVVQLGAYVDINRLNALR